MKLNIQEYKDVFVTEIQFSIFMHEIVVGVLELLSIIEKQERSSWQQLISYLQIFFSNSRKLEIEDKIVAVMCCYRKCNF